MSVRRGSKPLPAPFPAMGGKSTVADLIWSRVGSVRNFISANHDGRQELYTLDYREPFGNSLAVMLANPDYDWLNGRWLVDPPPLETVNDADPFISNFWRSLQQEPDAVAHWADYPVQEADLTARHAWLVSQGETWFADRMFDDPDFYDTKIAGWWVWGACMWIGSGWCSLSYSRHSGRTKDGGVEQKRPVLGHGGKGVHRTSLRDMSHFKKQRPILSSRGMGIHKGQIPYLSGHGQGIASRQHRENLIDYFERLADRLRFVRTVCGDWERVSSPSTTYLNNCVRGKDAITVWIFDPPYGPEAERTEGLYAVDDLEVAAKVREWCFKEVEDKKAKFLGPRCYHPRFRIVLCGYEDEHIDHIPDDWEMVAWAPNGGYGNRGGNNVNKGKERIWFSPNCLRPAEIETAVQGQLI
jgi:hypothetical protein